MVNLLLPLFCDGDTTNASVIEVKKQYNNTNCTSSVIMVACRSSVLQRACLLLLSGGSRVEEVGVGLWI